jgi:tetratricopeptide (TPR) repeat protein
MQIALDTAIEQKNWSFANCSADNLSELEVSLGNLSRAITHARLSLDFSNRSTNSFDKLASLGLVANALHQMGQRTEAFDFFRQADAFQAKRQPGYPLVISLRGFQYSNLMIAEAERCSWINFLQSQKRVSTKPVMPLSVAKTLQDEIREVEKRTMQILKWETEMPGAPLLDFALHHLTLGQISLYLALLTDSLTERNSSIDNARKFLNEAVKGLRDAGDITHVPRGLLTRAWLLFLERDADGAKDDLDEAWEIADRGPMRLHMADIALHRARLFGDKDALKQARDIIEQCGYWRRKEELIDAEVAASC